MLPSSPFSASRIVNEFALLMCCHLAVAPERCCEALVSKVLRPSPHLLPCQIFLAAEGHDRVTKSVRIEIGNSGPLERLSDDGAY